jgi:hypothetical protein
MAAVGEMDGCCSDLAGSDRARDPTNQLERQWWHGLDLAVI